MIKEDGTSDTLSHFCMFFYSSMLAKTSTFDRVVSYRKCMCDRVFLLVNDKKSLTRSGPPVKLYSVLYVSSVSFLLSSVYFFFLLSLALTGRIEPPSWLILRQRESLYGRARGEPEASCIFSNQPVTVSVGINKKKSKKQRKCNECKKGHECICG